jgi:hypothetical protein
MEKKNKIIILTIVLIVIIIVAVWLASSKQIENNQANITPVVEDGPEETTDERNFMGDKAIPPEQISIPENLDWREAVKESDFEVEFMTDAEKKAMNIASGKRVQVLFRDEETGIILAYKVINNDEDIITGSQEQ